MCSETYHCSLEGQFFYIWNFSTSVCFPGRVGICLPAILAEVDWSGYTSAFFLLAQPLSEEGPTGDGGILSLAFEYMKL